MKELIQKALKLEKEIHALPFDDFEAYARYSSALDNVYNDIGRLTVRKGFWIELD
jgi:hypothetical protein